jgi:hypothetical protein
LDGTEAPSQRLPFHISRVQHPKPELDPDRRGLKLNIRDIVSDGLLHPGLVDTVGWANSERIGHQVADGGELSTR